MLKKIALISILSLSLVLSGCSEDKKEESKTQTDKKKSSKNTKTPEGKIEALCAKVPTRFFWGDNGMSNYRNTVEKIKKRLDDVTKNYEIYKKALISISKSEKDPTQKTRIDALVSDLDNILIALPAYSKLYFENFKVRNIDEISDVTSSLPNYTQSEIAARVDRSKAYIDASEPLINTFNENEEHFWLNIPVVLPYTCFTEDPVSPGGLYPRYDTQIPQKVDL